MKRLTVVPEILYTKLTKVMLTKRVA